MHATLHTVAYLAHMSVVAACTAPIEFHCPYAMLGADAHSPRAHAYLVPDEGYAALSLPHHALHTAAGGRAAA